ncbi:MAG: hypothetical protein KR126chlam2_00643 [Chlamydiae bacterium]|nr:hypothetical protein [Chlamydiota bacterium]
MQLNLAQKSQKAVFVLFYFDGLGVIVVFREGFKAVALDGTNDVSLNVILFALLSAIGMDDMDNPA